MYQNLRRNDGKLPSARRRGHLSDTRAHGTGHRFYSTCCQKASGIFLTLFDGYYDMIRKVTFAGSFLFQNMNVLQRHNHAVLKKYILSPKIINSLTIRKNGVIELHDLEWQDYWGDNCLQSLLDKLFVSWHDWISSRFDQTKLNRYVYDYFRLLETALVDYLSGKINVYFLNKIVAFETFLISAPNSKNKVASLFSSRNPNYLLHKISNPIAHDDPKYLPVICQREQLGQTAHLYFHYRRIPIKHSHGTQLFVYPPVTLTNHEFSSFDVIDTLFRVLTRYNDPWVKLRCQSLAKWVFNDLIHSFDKSKINLLDLGCGSAKISMRLCSQAYNNAKSSFDMLLVDAIPSRFSIARSFYRNYQAFEAIRYRQSDLFDWVSSMHDSSATYDITLMLRIFDILCQYHPESLPIEHIQSSVKLSDATILEIPTSQLILDSPAKIVHSLHKIRTQSGSAYFQPALQDFFKSVFLCCNINSEAKDNREVVLPVRSFSENRLVMKDGTSIIGRIMEKSQYLVIEDSEVSLDLLHEHAKKRQLEHLTFTYKRPRQCSPNSHCILISHGNH